MLQREVPHFAKFCGGCQKQRIPKIIDFQDSSANCFRMLWSHLHFELQGNLLWDSVFCMLKIGLGSDEAPLYFIILQRRSYLRLCKFNHYLSQCQISHIKSS